jgi:hypothetical protein
VLADDVGRRAKIVSSKTLSGSARSGTPQTTCAAVHAIKAGSRYSSREISSRRQTVESHKHQAINVAQGHSLRRFALQHIGWCRRTRISASNPARERNSTIKAHQINLQMSLIKTEGSTDSHASVSRFGFAIGTALPKAILSRRRRSIGCSRPTI